MRSTADFECEDKGIKAKGAAVSGTLAKTKSRVLVSLDQSLFSDQSLSFKRRLYTSGTSDTGRLQALSVQLEPRSIRLFHLRLRYE